MEVFDGAGADVAKGLAWRMNLGSQYPANHFLPQTHFWGIIPVFVFTSEPQTNGAVGRFCHTLKKPAIA
jgi:putative transposase